VLIIAAVILVVTVLYLRRILSARADENTYQSRASVFAKLLS
jgi:hypothetical protein